MSTFDDISIPDMPAPRENTDAKIFAFHGAVGGVGVTSCAIETAHAMLKTQRAAGHMDPRICLIDLDFENGMIADYLDISTGVRADILTGDPARIDSAMISAMITKHASGLRLLSAQSQLAGNSQVKAECVLALMDIAATMYDVIILDVPRLWQPWTHAALAAADKVCVLMEMSIPALHRARARTENLEERIQPKAPFNFVISKLERRSFRNSITVKDAQSALGREISGSICVDPDTPRNAMNCGEPAGSLSPESRYVKDMTAIATTLLGEAQPAAPARKSRRLKRA